MAAGKNLLLKKETAVPGTFATLAGLRSKSLSINSELVDGTNHGSNEWKESVLEAGVKNMSVSGSGIFKTGAADLKAILLSLVAGTALKYQICDGTTGLIFEGLFRVTAFEYAGEYNAEQTYSISLESHGEITIEDAA